jgi:uncharacterized integral membrane protein
MEATRTAHRELFPAETRERRQWQVLAGGLIAACVLIALHGINAVTVEHDLLDLNTEQNVPSWATTFAFTVAGLLSLGLGACGREYRPWLLIGLLMLAFSLDDVAMLHERFEANTHESFALLVLEPLIALGILVLFAWAARTVKGLSRLLLVGTVVALVLAQAGSSLGSESESVPIPLSILIVIEEGSELLMGVLLAAAVVEPLMAALNRRLVPAD